MEKLLENAIIGEPIMVTLGEVQYEISFPIQAVILYKAETAKIDKKRSQGRPKLTADQRKALRSERLDILRKLEPFRPKKDKEWNEDDFAQFQALSEEANRIKVALDEDSCQGDSLYDLSNWDKIGPVVDPERLLLALWVGLHKSVNGSYLPSLTQEQIGRFINHRTSADLTDAISLALAKDLLPPAELRLKNGQAPESPAPTTTTTESPSQQESSTPSLALT